MTVNLGPNMLKILPIIPSSTPEKFIHSFLLFSYLTLLFPYYSFSLAVQVLIYHCQVNLWLNNPCPLCVILAPTLVLELKSLMHKILNKILSVISELLGVKLLPSKIFRFP